MAIDHQSLYFSYEEFPFVAPPELSGNGSRHSVTIVGAGPVGLTAALALVRQGVSVTVLEDEATLNIGSRAAGTARRSLEILDSLGAAERLVDKGVAWTKGQSYYGDKLVLDFSMPVLDNVKHPPMVNLQQCYVEQYILDELSKSPLATVRWSSAVKAVENCGDRVKVQVATPDGDYELESDWLIACDGARSVIRSSLGLRMEGTSYEGRYIVADVRLATDLPPGRRVWFDSAGNPDSTIILHRQPDNIWRIDYQLRDDEDSDRELEPERVRSRIQTFLDSVGIGGPWEIDWVSLYRAHSLSLKNYWHGRVLFAGDAAHLVPIFGARGMNGGIDDVFNLAWKLAYVVRGVAPPALLNTYTEERYFAFQENIRNANKSTKVMAPPTRGDLLMRDAVLELAVEHEFVRPLLNPRQSAEIFLRDSSLREPGDTTVGGLAPGQVCPNIKVSVMTDGTAETRYLHELLGPEFTVLVQGKADGMMPEWPATMHGLGLKTIYVERAGDTPGLCHIRDVDGAVAQAFQLMDGGAVLIRPDHHVLGRWREGTPDVVSAALRRVATWQ